MRLIYIPEFELDTIDGELPEYAILSHTWGSEEITFCDFEKLARKLRPPNEVHTDYLEYVTQFCKDKGKNFDKILGACKAAQQNNLDYLWVDTCCIDKSSSSELSESINSMFAWYEGAALCLAHLNDFKKTPRDFDPESFAKCRWFTRAWTLQELIAPQQVYFYNREWAPLGNKMLFARLLYDITKIETTFLTKETSIRTASVAKRMSWAAFREATREEDRAYSLLGIFGVNMPLIYGERSNSFIRLQEEILKEIDDHSIFAWIESPQIAQKGIITNCGHPKCLKPACDISICRNPSCTNPTCILFRETGHLKGCKDRQYYVFPTGHGERRPHHDNE
ncbi:hypothetical protein GQX73_g2270 [Xylaria multiplex]|uniref:Uncharacterized protein n=1 Tax=Xylaria multiplex TaxID=323545 RepID=A0A7C8J0Z8_9PEZI|nr:hypothetical protein GQX73_g2270 [Xylaria multiplex]